MDTYILSFLSLFIRQSPLTFGRRRRFEYLMSSWLKARDWASGVEYSSLFYSGLRAISLRRSRIRAQSAAPTLSPEKNLPRSSLSYLLRRGTSTKNPPTSKEPSLPPSHAEKVVRPRPSSMFVSSTKELDELWVTGGTFLDGTNDRQKSMCVYFMYYYLYG
jgi:hypothetical protein